MVYLLLVLATALRALLAHLLVKLTVELLPSTLGGLGYLVDG